VVWERAGWAPCSSAPEHCQILGGSLAVWLTWGSAKVAGVVGEPLTEGPISGCDPA
jgi:hypothetical protein